MKIECILRRQGGSHVEIGGTNYHFAPAEADPRHLAEVEDEEHIARLLSITEGYRFAGSAAPAKASTPKPPVTPKATPPAQPKSPLPAGAADPGHSHGLKDAGNTHSITDPGHQIVDPSAGAKAQANMTDPAAGEGNGQSEPASGQGEQGGQGAPNYENMERDELVKLYVERFNSQPPPRIGKAALVIALNEKAE